MAPPAIDDNPMFGIGVCDILPRVCQLTVRQPSGWGQPAHTCGERGRFSAPNGAKQRAARNWTRGVPGGWVRSSHSRG